MASWRVVCVAVDWTGRLTGWGDPVCTPNEVRAKRRDSSHATMVLSTKNSLWLAA